MRLLSSGQGRDDQRSQRDRRNQLTRMQLLLLEVTRARSAHLEP